MATVTVVIEDGLIPELEIAALRCHCSAQQWAADAVEAALATRRLPSVRQAMLGPRVQSQRANTSQHRFPEQRDTEPMLPIDIPTVTDLDTVSDIT